MVAAWDIKVYLCVFCVLQETREKVKLLLQLADSLVEKGHAHASNIKQWVAAVDKRYKDFSSRMEKYRVKLETTLGLSHDVSASDVIWRILDVGSLILDQSEFGYH